MPRNPEPGETMMSGLRVWGVQLAWGLLGIIPLIIGTIAGLGVMLSFIGSALAPDSGAITSPAFSWVGQTLATIVILAGLALYIACMILASAGVARVALYGRAKAGLPLNGVLAFAKLNGWGFWKALGTSLLAMLPLFAWTIAVEWWLGAYQGDRPSFLASYTLFLPAGLVWFPARLISARAWGRWLREIGPGTLPALESRPPASSGSEAYTGEAEPLPEPSSDPFSDAD
jgi:hypothetical protein